MAITKKQTDKFVKDLFANIDDWVSKGNRVSSILWGETYPAYRKEGFTGDTPCPLSVALLSKKLKKPKFILRYIKGTTMQHYCGSNIVETTALAEHYNVPVDFMLGVAYGYSYLATLPKAMRQFCKTTTLPSGHLYEIESGKDFTVGASIGKMIRSTCGFKLI